MSPLLKLALEIGPLAAYFITFNRLKGEMSELDALLAATGIFIVAMVASLSVIYAVEKAISRVALMTLVVVLAMGGLTLWLQDKLFLLIRPTLVNGAFALALAYGLYRGQSYLKLLIGELMPMTDEGWMKLTRNWAFFFAFMAVLNEVVWRTQSVETWVAAKTFAYLPITILFTLSQTPLMAKHAISDGREDGETSS